MDKQEVLDLYNLYDIEILIIWMLCLVSLKYIHNILSKFNSREWSIYANNCTLWTPDSDIRLKAYLALLMILYVVLGTLSSSILLLTVLLLFLFEQLYVIPLFSSMYMALNDKLRNILFIVFVGIVLRLFFLPMRIVSNP